MDSEASLDALTRLAGFARLAVIAGIAGIAGPAGLSLMGTFAMAECHTLDARMRLAVSRETRDPASVKDGSENAPQIVPATPV